MISSAGDGEATSEERGQQNGAEELEVEGERAVDAAVAGDEHPDDVHGAVRGEPARRVGEEGGRRRRRLEQERRRGRDHLRRGGQQQQLRRRAQARRLRVRRRAAPLR